MDLVLLLGVVGSLRVIRIYFVGVSFGKEGPFVHLSCIIATQLCRVFKRLNEVLRSVFLWSLENKELKLQLLSAATGVGVASNFGAPIGGVLFSVEVTSTYYPGASILKEET